MIGSYFRLEALRMLRDPKYLVLSVIAPIGFYLLFATIFGGTPGHAASTVHGVLPGTVEIMVAMAAFGGIWGALSATGPRIANERGSGWLRQARAMPVTARQVTTAKLAAGMAVALPAVIFVCATAAAAKGVTLAAWQWPTLVGAMWIGTLPFAVLGVAIGYLTGPDAAFPLCYGLYLALSALGGLWVPPAALPTSLRDVAEALPTYRLADLGWHLTAGHAPTVADVVILAAWTFGFGLLAAVAYRGPRRMRARTVTGTAAAA